MIGWNWMFLEGMTYVAGALLYAVRKKKKALLNENITADLFIPQFRIPERWRPGSFDVWGASHQIFHVCAVLGAALHYKGLLKGFDYNHSPSSRQC